MSTTTKEPQQQEIVNAPDHVIDNLYISDYKTAKSLEELQKNNISRVIICGEGMETPFPDQVEYLKFVFEDSEDQKIDHIFETASEFISRSRLENKNVLVHCQKGVSRSATVVLAHLIKDKEMPLEEAKSYLKEKRPIISPNPGFVKQLEKYEEEIKVVKEGSA